MCVVFYNKTSIKNEEMDFVLLFGLFCLKWGVQIMALQAPESELLHFCVVLAGVRVLDP